MNSEASAAAPSKALIGAAILAVYVVWGSTYFAIRLALEGFAPFVLAGLRFTVAGSLMLAWLKARGAPWPNARQWLGCAAMGVLLLVMGNGFVVIAETEVASGLAAVMVASSPLWAALFAGMFGRWPEPREWAGLVVGAIGVAVLNLGGDLRASPLGAVMLLLAPCAWAFGSMWSKRLSLPSGAMNSACQMICAGPMMLVLAFVRGAPLPAHVTPKAGFALLYLALFGSIVAYSAYTFLLRAVRPSVAMSYAYVNPVVAVLLGVGFGGEAIGRSSILGMAIVLGGVVLVLARRSPAAPPKPAPSTEPVGGPEIARGR